MIFLRPVLLVLLIVPVLWFFLKQKGFIFNPWKKIISPALLPFLIRRTSGISGARSGIISVVVWSLLVIGAAGPSFKSEVVPVAQSASGTVVIMDITRGMSAQNLKIARTKLYDLLAYLKQQGQAVALVLFDEKGYVAAPLTYDTEIIKQLIPSLSPEVLPTVGIQPEAGFKVAQDLLNQTQTQNGRFFFITSGVVNPDRVLRNKEVSVPVAVLGVGSETEGAPVMLPAGGFLKEASGQPVIARLNPSELSRVGVYHKNTPDNTDIQKLLQATDKVSPSGHQADAGQTSVPQDAGFWFVLMCLPVVLISLFRPRIAVLLTCCVPVLAQAGFWERDDVTAYHQAQDGIQKYQQQDYVGAGDVFKMRDESDWAYNLGNALAFQGKIQPAIDAYNRALVLNPSHDDARHNKAWLEEQLKKQQQAQQNNQDESDKQSDLSDTSDQSQSSQGQNQSSVHQQSEEQRSDAASRSVDENQAASPSGQNGQQSESAGTGGHQAQQEAQSPESADRSVAASSVDIENQAQSPHISDQAIQQQVDESMSEQVGQERSSQMLDQESQQIFNLISKDPTRVLRYRLYRQYQAGGES